MRRCSSWQRVMSRSRRVWFPGVNSDSWRYWSIHWPLPSQTYLCFQAFDVAQLMPDSFNSVASLVQFRFIAALFNLGWLDRILYPLPQMTSHWTHGVGLLTASDFDRDIRPRPCISCFLVSFRWLCAYWSDWSGKDFKIACHCKRHSETEPRLRHLGSDRTAFARKWHGGYGSLPDYPSAHAPYVTRSAWYVAAQGPKRFRSSACLLLAAWCVWRAKSLWCSRGKVSPPSNGVNGDSPAKRCEDMHEMAWALKHCCQGWQRLKTSPGYQHSLL